MLHSRNRELRNVGWVGNVPRYVIQYFDLFVAVPRVSCITQVRIIGV
jgi:hypothetical protein